MFNPQRKSKLCDIYMQEKGYKIHLQKMNQIQKEYSSKAKKRVEDDEHRVYLSRLQKNKNEVRERLSTDLRVQNRRIMQKLIQAETSQPSLLKNQAPLVKKDHFNSYFSLRKGKAKIHHDNYTMVMRIDKVSSSIPSLQELKKQYRQSRKYSKNCQKLPTIIRYEEKAKKRLSTSAMDAHENSRVSHSKKSSQQVK